jgi:hypothetical protein
VKIHKLDFLRKAQLLHVACYCIGMCKYVVMLYNNAVSATEFRQQHRMSENIITCENVFQKEEVMVATYTAPRRSPGKYADLPCLMRFMSN